jgi:hypothetical protein
MGGRGKPIGARAVAGGGGGGALLLELRCAAASDGHTRSASAIIAVGFISYLMTV